MKPSPENQRKATLPGPQERRESDMRCWCGNTALVAFSEHYVHCKECNTLVSLRGPKSDPAQVTDDAHDFYGRHYWDEHQAEYGYPSIRERMYNELPERCAFWLLHVMQYRLPPAKTLELGCSHGGFVYLMRQAGYDAAGLELSRWVGDFASRSFGVPVFHGLMENQGFSPGQFDMLLMMDVLEHFFAPSDAMQRYADFIADNGMIAIQTPRFCPDLSYEELVSSQSPFLTQLKEKEHLYIFSTESITRLLHSVGFESVAFRDAIFSQYDQFLFASRRPLTHITAKQRERHLKSLGRNATVLLQTAFKGQKRSRFLQTAADERLLVIENLQRQVNELVVRDDTFKRHQESQAETISRLESALSIKTKANAKRKVRLTSLKSQLDRIRAKTKAMEAVLAKHVSNLPNLEDQRAGLANQFSEQEKIITYLRTDLDLRNQEVLALARRNTQLRSRQSVIRQHIAKLKSAVRSLQADATQTRRRRDHLRHALLYSPTVLNHTRHERNLIASQTQSFARQLKAEEEYSSDLARCRTYMEELDQTRQSLLTVQSATIRALSFKLVEASEKQVHLSNEYAHAVTLLKDIRYWKRLNADRKLAIISFLESIGHFH